MQKLIFFFRRLLCLPRNTSSLEVLASLPNNTEQCQLNYDEAQNGTSGHFLGSKANTLAETLEVLEGQTLLNW